MTATEQLTEVQEQTKERLKVQAQERAEANAEAATPVESATPAETTEAAQPAAPAESAAAPMVETKTETVQPAPQPATTEVEQPAQPAETTVEQKTETVEAPAPAASAEPQQTTETVTKKTETTTEQKPTYTPVMDYMTGEEKNIDDGRLRRRYESANRGVENLLKYVQIYGPNLTNSQIESALGDDIWAFNIVYGNKNANWAVAFGSGMHGAVPPSTRDAVSKIVQAYNTREAEREKSEAAKAEEEANQPVDIDGYSVTKEFADEFKELAALYNSVQDGDTEASQQKAQARRQQIMGAIYEKMRAAGFPLRALNEGEAMPSSIDDLLALAVEDANDVSVGLKNEASIQKIMQEALRDRSVKKDAKSLDDIIREREELKAQVDLRDRNRQLQRAKLRSSAVELAAAVGELIRAKEGAPVSSRDWKNIYDNLSKQERANIDNYQLRMQKLKDDARAQRLAAAQAAAAAGEKDADRQSREKIAALQEEGRNKRWKDKLENDLAKAALEQGEEVPTTTSKSYDMPRIRLEGKDYSFRPQTYKSIVRNIYAVIKETTNLGIKDSVVGIDRDNELLVRVPEFLRNNFNSLKESQKKDIRAILGVGQKIEKEQKEETTQASAAQVTVPSDNGGDEGPVVFDLPE